MGCGPCPSLPTTHACILYLQAPTLELTYLVFPQTSVVVEPFTFQPRKNYHCVILQLLLQHIALDVLSLSVCNFPLLASTSLVTTSFLPIIILSFVQLANGKL